MGLVNFLNIMKVLIVLALVAVAYASVLPTETEIEFSAFGFIEKYAIPLGEKIRQAEEQNAQQRIIGGSPSRLGEFPYQAGLLGSFINIEGTGVCGGSLVTANRVITAAHCWYDGQNQAWRFTVVLGSVTLFTGGTRLESSAVAMHPQWSPSLIRNDVAVIYLPNAVSFSAIISPISLPTASEANLNFAGASAVASGFGLTQDGGQITVNQFLSHVTLNVITNQRCSLLFPFVVQQSNICTSSIGTVSTCSGDSGGPLAVTVNNRPVLIGITSFGLAFGCELRWPAVFARTTSFMDFFNQHI